MLAKRNLCRFLAALISLSLLFGAAPSFAMTGCAEMSKMPMQSHMAMPSKMMMAMPMTKAADTSNTSHQKAPCKMPAGQCASLCAAMASVALTPMQIAIAMPVRISEVTVDVSAYAKGVAPPPALPPPILLA